MKKIVSEEGAVEWKWKKKWILFLIRKIGKMMKEGRKEGRMEGKKERKKL